MSNGKFVLALKEPEKGKVKSTRHKKDKVPKSPRIDMIGIATMRFFTIPFALFVGFLEFFSCGFEAGLRKMLTMLEGAKDDNAVF
jgi:hypothetical protein